MNTAVFRIERPTPGRELNPATKALRDAIPFLVEVQKNPIDRPLNFGSACGCAVIFVLTDQAVELLIEIGLMEAVDSEGNFDGENPAVCNCMGRICA